MSTKAPLIVILSALALTALIYFGANTIPPKPKATAGTNNAQGGMQEMSTNLDVDSLIIASKKGLSQHALSELQKADQDLRSARDSSQLPAIFEQYAQIWKEHKQFPLAAYYYYLAAKLENSEKKLTFAAQLFLDLARKEHEAPLQNWEALNAIDAFSRILVINPNNDSVKLTLAECYFGTGAAMKGVALVKEITAKDPENVAANLLLGQQGLVSQQFDKAQQRFETVLKNEPKNVEAMLGLAESYKGLGEKEKAKTILEECKTLIDNPEFVKDIDQYIKTF